jgi:two-component system cell cycle response regulator
VRARRHDGVRSLVYGGAGAAAVAVYLVMSAFEVSPTAQTLWYVGISLSGAVAVVAGVRIWKPAHPVGWYLLAAGQAVYACADLVFYSARSVLGIETYPYYDDALYLLSYPILAFGLYRFVRARTPTWNLTVTIDAAIISVAVAVLLWVYVIGPKVLAEDATLLAHAVSIAYPAMDVLLLSFALRLIMGSGFRSGAYWSLVYAILVMFAADVAYGILELSDGFVAGGVLDALWLSVSLALGTAALHPSMRALTTEVPVAAPAYGAWRFLLLFSACACAPALQLREHAYGSDDNVVAFGVASLLLFPLALARMAALALAQRQLADHDALTGLWNRRYLNTALDTRITSPRKAGATGLLLLDVDHFKKVNDTFGHHVGDLVLAEVAAALSTAVRRGDLVARYGGEEFAVLMADVTGDELIEAAERVRRTVAAAPIHVDGGAVLTVTVSVGGARALPGESDSNNLLREADLRLYAAKAAGRNRVVATETPQPTAA